MAKTEVSFECQTNQLAKASKVSQVSQDECNDTQEISRYSKDVKVNDIETFNGVRRCKLLRPAMYWRMGRVKEGLHLNYFGCKL